MAAIRRYRVELELNSAHTGEVVSDWLRRQFLFNPTSPAMITGKLEVDVQEVDRDTVTLDSTHPELVRPSRGSETYRVQIPGLPEGASKPVWDPNVDPERLARILALNAEKVSDTQPVTE